MSSSIAVKKPFQIELKDGYTIHGDVEYVEDGTAKPIILLSHGFRGHKDWGFWPYAAARFAERGFYAVRYNFVRVEVKNSGGSEEAVQRVSTVSRELDDLEAVLTYAVRKLLPAPGEYDQRRIALVGHSRAGAGSIIFASEHQEISAVIAWNGGPKPSPAGGNVSPAVVEDLLLSQKRFDTTRLLSKLAIPVLIVQGSSDAERLLEGNRTLRAVAPEHSYVTIDGANHTFGISHPFTGTTSYLEEALEISIAFLQKTL
ncbi:alpha/beta hydrolase family protein [Paenibacillus allorhizosphaerae]|uniref:Alpha/beta hydrolase n=1 Tax=Paenibacillus allorhizosphaerae TaxID=2849866 RepID=A0ABN7TYU7_9BACL|nr:dienelactone hydrolase family protein [Paenibacillus allorhizosphaerae]CAG7657470.1 hypothetical protein PAECIP111802_06736 [Paenibacillus allorhizosphaerae]